MCRDIGSRTGLHPMSPDLCTLSRVSYAVLPRYCRNYAFRFSMLDETVETRRPWRGSPCPAIRGRAFLCIVCIIQQYLGSFAIRSRKRACPSRSHGIKPLTLWQKKKKFDDKAPPLCYNQLKALYFCKRHHITIFYRCTPL